MEALGTLQVVDLTDGIAGPITGMFMADFGAEVVKIEPPRGDPGREQPGLLHVEPRQEECGRRCRPMPTNAAGSAI